MKTIRVLSLTASMVLVTSSITTRPFSVVIGAGGPASGTICACPVAYDDGMALDDIPPAPTLSVEHKQAIQILAQRIELAQLRAQAAQTEFDRASTELTALLKGLTKEGYDLNLQTLAYVKKPDPPKTTGGSK